MIKTATTLLASLMVLASLVYYFSEPMSELQIAMIQHTGLVMLGSVVFCFVLSEITRNCSQFDKLWSILPVVYAWMFAREAGWDSRPVLMAVLVSIWGIRLTYNFGRRGGYSWKFWEGEEDYRWEVLRRRKEFQSKTVWTLFNLFFISFYQNALVWMFTLPPVMAIQATDSGLQTSDWIFSVLFVGLVVVETIADQQQWNFQNRKHAKLKSGELLNAEEKGGFIRSGLWAYCRHPNYAAEQSIWIVFYLMGAVASGIYFNWTITGSVLLVMLFRGSSDFSEAISAEKYPEYKTYQKRVPRFIPRLFGAKELK